MSATRLDLDKLEERAVQALRSAYPVDPGGVSGFWAQRGIEAMRLAVAEAQEDDEGC